MKSFVCCLSGVNTLLVLKLIGYAGMFVDTFSAVSYTTSVQIVTVNLINIVKQQSSWAQGHSVVWGYAESLQQTDVLTS